MGTRSKSILGDIRGKAGQVVLTSWKNVLVIKGLSAKTKKVSEGQQFQRLLFKCVMQFLAKATDCYQLGYQLPRKANVTEMNLATAYHLANAVVGEYPNFSIELSKVKFSNALRPTENGWNAKLSMAENSNAVVSWEINPFPEKVTQLDDQAVVVIYDTVENIFRLHSKGVQRRQLSFEIDWSMHEGSEIYYWLFFISVDGKFVSETEFLGSVMM